MESIPDDYTGEAILLCTEPGIPVKPLDPPRADAPLEAT